MLQIVVRKAKAARLALRQEGISACVSRIATNLRVLVARVTGIEIDGSRFKVSGFPEEVWRDLMIGDYEASERRSIREYLDPQRPLVELGGCMGVVACIADRLLEQPQKHIVVEASPQFVPIIRANAIRNKCEFTIVNAALAYGCDNITFYINPQHPDTSSLTPLTQNLRPVNVPTTRLESLFEKYAITNCSLVCDIEGAEYEMIKNELSVISEHVSTMIMEVHPILIGQKKTLEMLSALASAGFQTRDIIGDVYILARH
jgi:FkbM family methyltransferase